MLQMLKHVEIPFCFRGDADFVYFSFFLFLLVFFHPILLLDYWISMLFQLLYFPLCPFSTWYYILQNNLSLILQYFLLCMGTNVPSSF
jgi:hypothetical protein